MATTEEIMLQVKVENSEALNNILEQKKAVEGLKAANADLQKENKALSKSLDEMTKSGKANTEEFSRNKKQLEENNKTLVANAEAMKAANKEIAENSRYIQNNIKAAKENGDSIEAMRGRLNALKQEYYALSKAQRENIEVGGAMQKQIKTLNDEISSAEQSVGDFWRNVGNYADSIKSAIGTNKGFVGQVAQMSEMAKETGQSFGKVLVKGIKSVGSAFKALLANPIILVLAGIVTVITAVTDAIKGNEEQTRKLQKVFAPLQAILGIIKGLFSALASVLVNVMEWIGKVTGGIATFMEKIPFVGKLIKQVNDVAREAIKIEDDKQKLQDATRQNTLDQAKTEKEVSELRAKYEDKEIGTAKERLKFLEDAISKEQEQAKKNLELKKEELRLARLTADESTESKEELIRLEAELEKEEKNYNDKMRSLAKEQKAAVKEVADEEKKAIEERKKKHEEYLKTVESGQKKIRDLTLELMQEGIGKEKALRQKQYEEELKGIEGTEEQKAEIRRLLAEQYNRDVAAIDEKYSQEAFDKEVSKKTAELEIMLELARGNADKELEIKLQQLDIERNAAIWSAEETGVGVELVEQQFAQRKADLESEAAENRKMAQAERLQEYLEGLSSQYEQELVLYAENELEKSRIKIEQAQAEEEALLSMDEETKAQLFANEEAYNQAVGAATAKRIQAEQGAAEETKKARLVAVQSAQDQMDQMKQVAGSLTDMLNMIAGDNEEMQGFLKAVALFQIGVDMAKAIAGAVAGAMDVGFPACIPALAAALAAVTAGIIQAKQTLSKQKEVNAPKFSTGGLVEGPGTGTSDSISAHLSNGESVINARSTAMFAPLLSSINQAGGGMPITLQGSSMEAMGTEYMAESISAAMQLMPNPVVSVQEITTVNSRVAVNETLRNR